MKLTLAFLLVFGTATRFVMAADPPAAGVAGTPAAGLRTTNLPKVDQILDRYVQASGGKTALQKLTSRIIQGKLEMVASAASFDWTLYGKVPNKRATILDVAGFGKVLEGFNGKVAWSQMPNSSPTEKSGAELLRAQREAEFYRELKLKELYAELIVQGVTKVGEREAYLVVARPKQGNPEKLYFDVNSGLLVRQDSQLDTGNGPTNMELEFEDYRPVDGIKLPYTIRANQPEEMKFKLVISEYRHNTPIDDAKFEKPVEK